MAAQGVSVSKGHFRYQSAIDCAADCATAKAFGAHSLFLRVGSLLLHFLMATAVASQTWVHLAEELLDGLDEDTTLEELLVA